MREGHDGRQYTPVVATEYQRWPSAVLSRATTRAHRGSSATDVGFGLVVLAGDAVIFLGPSYGAGETISPCPAAHTPVLASNSIACGGGVGSPANSRPEGMPWLVQAC